ncbi:MAG: ABC transporter permease subunit [Candidatus Latescibacteria bacterium]|nr:ABC transporter permease subunit [Candidatus Latescibacterota bacterium]
MLRRWGFRGLKWAPRANKWGAIVALGRVRISFLILFGLVYTCLLVYPSLTDQSPEHQQPYSPEEIDLDSLDPGQISGPARQPYYAEYEAPGWEHLLGTDGRGRDVLLRLATGARTSLSTGLVCLVSFLVVGVTWGILLGFFANIWSRIASYPYILISAFPMLILLLLGVIIIDDLVQDQEGRLYALMVCFGVFSSSKLAELVRGRIISLKKTSFVQAAEALGLSRRQILLKHLVWYECRSLIAAQGAYILGQAIVVEVTLTYLKFGVEYPGISWGLMFREMAGVVEWPVFTVMGITAMAIFFFHHLAGSLSDYWAHEGER